MTFSVRSRGDDPDKSLEFLKRLGESPVSDEVPPGDGFAENELIEKFHKSMLGYAVDRWEPLSPPPEKHETDSQQEQNMVVRVTYVSGSVYEGEVFKWLPNGKGRLFLQGDVTYEGQLKDGFPEGRGMIRWPDTSWYEGEIQKGLRHGRGMHVSGEDGRRWYGGQWKDGKRHGLGQTDCGPGESDGALSYDGHWVDGRPHGHGTGVWPDGTRYTGGWAHGRQHGRGKMVWPENDVYEGDWVDGLMDGTGTYEWASNPRDKDRLVICSCDKYTGQWSKSKKHGMGEFYSAETGWKVRGSWSDDVLDGPCKIVLGTGRLASSSGLEFRRNVLYETPTAATRPATNSNDRKLPVPSPGRGGSRLPVPSPGRGGSRLSARSVETVSRSFQSLCKPLPEVAGNDYGQKGHGIRANIPSVAVGAAACDLSGHVRRLAAAAAAETTMYSAGTIAIDPELELRAVELAIAVYADRLEELYRTYGAFLADGPVAYRPLMTRLGLWQMLIDSGLHVRISLADFDDLLLGIEDCAFNSAHDPFELVYFWQFVHAVCELATFVYDVRQIRRQDARSAALGLMAAALHRLFEEHLRTDVVPASYAITAGIGDFGESWTNDRRTLASMHDLYRTMTMTETGSAAHEPPLPTALRLIRLYGPRLAVDGPRTSLDSVLPDLLHVVLESLDGHVAPVGLPKPTAMFECSVDTVVAMLCEACPRIADARGALVNVETRLVFAEWYHFVLLCVRDCRRLPALDRNGGGGTLLPQSSQTSWTVTTGGGGGGSPLPQSSQMSSATSDPVA